MHTATPSPQEEYLRLDASYAQDVAVMEAMCFSAPWSEEHIVRLLGTDSFLLFGVRRSGKLLAYLAASLPPGSDILEIYTIMVLPSERGMGMGRRLLRFVMDSAAARGALRVVLEVRPSNAPAIAMYAALGFARCGVRRAYYRDTGEDALVYAAELVPPDHI